MSSSKYSAAYSETFRMSFNLHELRTVCYTSFKITSRVGYNVAYTGKQMFRRSVLVPSSAVDTLNMEPARSSETNNLNGEKNTNLNNVTSQKTGILISNAHAHYTSFLYEIPISHF